MREILFVAWSIAAPAIVWAVMYRRERVLSIDNERLRRWNGESAADFAELEAKLHDIRREAETHGRTIELIEVRRAELAHRAELAERIVRGQAKHIEALETSNAKLLESVITMRRTGYALPSDILNAPDPELITTVDDDDAQALRDKPEWIAAEE